MSVRTVAIIQARLDSIRLPQKVLLPICGKPMLCHVLNRVRKSRFLDEVVVTTPDKRIADLCKMFEIGAYLCEKEQEADVLQRYYMTAQLTKTTTIIRITSDCPLVDPEIIDRAICVFRASSTDYLTTVGSYPDGFDTEIFSYNILEETHNEAKDPYDREHVTTYIINSSKFTKTTLQSPIKLSKLGNPHLSVDTIQDLDNIREIFQSLGEDFSFMDVVKYLKEKNESKVSR